MCGRYALILPPEAIRQLFRFFGPAWNGATPNWPARYNVAPTQDVPVLRAPNEIAQIRWGLVPSWSKVVGTAPLINARGESVAEKPSFRNAFKSRRCLVPADGFYEWRIEGKLKVPMYIRMKSKEPLVFGGIWDRWTAPDGQSLDSMAIVTTGANRLIGQLHDRMPLILAAKDWERWLTDKPESAQTLIQPCPDDWLEYFTVSRRVNSVANDGPELIDPEAFEPVSAAPPKKPKAKSKPKDTGGQGSLF
jgi:putative SOS response-associated peptidase YedK